MKVRLLRKFADLIDGIDLSRAKTGEVLEVSAHDANLLIAEGWAEYTGGTRALDNRADEHPRRKRTPRSPKKC